jgi:hypothetical protein
LIADTHQYVLREPFAITERHITPLEGSRDQAAAWLTQRPTFFIFNKKSHDPQITDEH